MNKLSICVFAATLCVTAPLWAGDSIRTVHTVSSDSDLRAHESADDPWEAMAVKVHHPRQYHGALMPFIFVGRAFNTFLHHPQILSEGIEGDRALVNHRGILAPREVPSEDQIFSPDE